MRPELEKEELDGRLECPNPKCGAQVGRYAWQGMRCSCGIWVCPAFSLQKGRVDEVIKKTDAGKGRDGFRVADAGDNGIRLPPGMKGKGSL
jgi:dual specificity phosphatase 12